MGMIRRNSKTNKTNNTQRVRLLHQNNALKDVLQILENVKL